LPRGRYGFKKRHTCGVVILYSQATLTVYLHTVELCHSNAVLFFPSFSTYCSISVLFYRASYIGQTKSFDDFSNFTFQDQGDNLMPEFLHIRGENTFINDLRSPNFAPTCCISKTMIVIYYQLKAKKAHATTSLSLSMMHEWQLTNIIILLQHTSDTHLPIRPSTKQNGKEYRTHKSYTLV
jgi:hypothetical protein